MSDTRKRMIVLAVTVIAVMALLVVGVVACSGGPLARNLPSATPTKTPKPTFTATPIPTDTPLPTDTPTPTNTATSTPLPTNTPIVYTATPTPTDTATPIPTPTRAPTRVPTRVPTRRPPPTAAPPTNTPAPQFPWRGDPAGTFANCGLTAFIGLTLDRNGAVAGDIIVHYWTDGWDGAWAVSEWVVNQGYPGEGDEKNWDGIINNHAVAGNWKACVVAQKGSWDCISNTMSFTSVASPCEDGSGGVQIFRIVFRKN
jgi:hypothetical protein